jgi:hypothetical protein
VTYCTRGLCAKASSPHPSPPEEEREKRSDSLLQDCCYMQAAGRDLAVGRQWWSGGWRMDICWWPGVARF